jgi:mannose-1-phosphate guanylyltransferase/mannose-6-phosphate isomerase
MSYPLSFVGVRAHVCGRLCLKHRLENPGKTDLELIEVQSGSYLGEDDIVRFEDTYGRG